MPNAVNLEVPGTETMSKWEKLILAFPQLFSWKTTFCIDWSHLTIWFGSKSAPSRRLHASERIYFKRNFQLLAQPKKSVQIDIYHYLLSHNESIKTHSWLKLLSHCKVESLLPLSFKFKIMNTSMLSNFEGWGEKHWKSTKSSVNTLPLLHQADRYFTTAHLSYWFQQKLKGRQQCS